MIEREQSGRIRDWAVQRRLPAAIVERWLGLDAADRDALLALAEGLRLRTGQFVSAFELLEETRLRDGGDVAGILARGELRGVIEGGGSRPERAHLLLEGLRAIRFPRLRAAAAGLAEKIAELKLPLSIRVVLPQNLGSDELRVELTARSGAELEELLDALAARRTALCRIADALGGSDEFEDEF
ncbi:MAG TPA: hypothetical protein VKS22_14795 [Candidatus Binataceae bacterium]|nr:hypothetical protein [Candidatus Binataceae bacterium]